MDENSGRSLSVDTYLSKQESLLVEHIRRLLQAETKIHLLETGIQELHKRNKELTEQVETFNVTVNQSIAGLQAVTLERDKLQQDNESLKSSLKTCNTKLNDQLIVNTELEKLKERLRVSEDDYATLKENYNRVLAMLPQTVEPEPEPEPVQEKKSKKVKSTESEWTDGKY
jgi:chromosome segregation ATPase